MTLLVIDIQKALMCDELYDYQCFLKRITRLINIARKNNVEVIYFQHDAGKGSGFSQGDEGFEIFDQVKPLKEEKIFIKTINSCFGNSEFANYLEKKNEKELMIIGLQTDFCIDATIKSAFERGFKVYVPKGTNSTFNNKILSGKKVYKFYNEWVWPDCFANCISMQDAVRLLKNDIKY